jgi:hypothetical protein
VPLVEKVLMMVLVLVLVPVLMRVAQTTPP